MKKVSRVEKKLNQVSPELVENSNPVKSIDEEISQLMEVNPDSKMESSGSIRTIFIFLDLPFHYEFRAGYLPILPKSTHIEFKLNLTDPKDPNKSRRVEGNYYVKKSRLIYSSQRASLMGLTQYLEMELYKNEDIE